MDSCACGWTCLVIAWHCAFGRREHCHRCSLAVIQSCNLCCENDHPCNQLLCVFSRVMLCRMKGHMWTATGQLLMILQLSVHPQSVWKSQLSVLSLSQGLSTSTLTPVRALAKQKGAGLPLHQTPLPLEGTLLPFQQTQLTGRVAISLTLMTLRPLLPTLGLHLMSQMPLRAKTTQQTAVSSILLSSKAQECNLMTGLCPMPSLDKTIIGGHTQWHW